MKISVITPTCRKNALDMNLNCLERQTFKDFEWIIGYPLDEEKTIFEFLSPLNISYLIDSPKKEGDFYGLNKSWNAMIKQSQGELIVSIVDGLWFPPNTLQSLWYHYRNDPMACIGGVGDQFDKVENGKPENRVWVDPRKKGQSFYEIPPYDLELCIASLPMKGIKAVGGFDEQFDEIGPAWSEKDLACRMGAIGYKCYLDESCEYRAIHHPRLQGSKWDELYPASTARFQKCYNEIQEGKRLKLDYI